MASAGGERLSASEFKKRKEIDEARKAGTLPPEEDEEGNLINPHNPDYISKRPWYLGDSGPSLKHQGIQKSNDLLNIKEADLLYVRGKKIRKTNKILKYRKGGCENCGAMSHKKIECVERPRKIGAWKTNKDIREDEILIDIRSEKYGKLSFDAKRDTWLGYDPSKHQETINKYNIVENERKLRKIQEINDTFEKDEKYIDHSNRSSNINNDKNSNQDSDSDYESDISSENEEYKDKDGGRVISERVARQGGLGGAQMKVTVRNLRIREDTAKYLRNLNPNSAYYDPKTRSMRDNPNPELNTEDSLFVGDNFIRNTGDAKRFYKNQLFAWEAANKTNNNANINPSANPSQVELLQKQYIERKKKLLQERQEIMKKKYGDQKNYEIDHAELIHFAQNEQFNQYTSDGRIIKGTDANKGIITAISKYIEDVYENNHFAVWGSFYDKKNHIWGYSCCESTIRNSYCTGTAGIEAKNSSIITE